MPLDLCIIQPAVRKVQLSKMWQEKRSVTSAELSLRPATERRSTKENWLYISEMAKSGTDEQSSDRVMYVAPSAEGPKCPSKGPRLGWSGHRNFKEVH